MVKAKKPSGAENRKRRKQQREAIAAEIEAGLNDGANDFADLPDPADADDAVTAMELTRRYQLRGLSVAAKRPLTEGLQRRLKFIAQFSEGIGMTQQRADLEERVANAERLLANVKPHAAVKTATTAGSARPARSRGTRRPLRPVPPVGHKSE